MRANQWITGASSLALICAAGFAQIAGAQQPQVPIPQTASEVPGPTLGPMTTAYVQTRQSICASKHYPIADTLGHDSKWSLFPPNKS